MFLLEFPPIFRQDRCGGGFFLTKSKTGLGGTRYLGYLGYLGYGCRKIQNKWCPWFFSSTSDIFLLPICPYGGFRSHFFIFFLGTLKSSSSILMGFFLKKTIQRQRGTTMTLCPGSEARKANHQSRGVGEGHGSVVGPRHLSIRVHTEYMIYLLCIFSTCLLYLVFVYNLLTIYLLSI